MRSALPLRKLIAFFKVQDGGRRHLGFWKICIFPPGSLKVSARCTLLKFGENRFILAETIIVLSKFKMEAAAILNFAKNLFFAPGDR